MVAKNDTTTAIFSGIETTVPFSTNQAQGFSTDVTFVEPQDFASI
jgi:hypothetical protein